MLDLMPRAAAVLARPARRDAAGLLEAVLADPGTVAACAVARLGLDSGALVAAAGQAQRAPGRGAGDGLEWDRDRWARRAEDEALRRGHGYIGTEHLLLGLLHAEPVAGALAASGSSARALRGQVHRTLCDASPTYGWADPLRGVPVTADTRFRAGSVTKLATTLLMLRLRDHGMIDLDEPATAKLHSVRLCDRNGAPSSATVRQLLTHTSGLPRGSGLRHYAGQVPPAGELFAAGIRADRPAGQWSYSNLGFVALGALAADLLGTPFGECPRCRRPGRRRGQRAAAFGGIGRRDAGAVCPVRTGYLAGSRGADRVPRPGAAGRARRNLPRIRRRGLRLPGNRGKRRASRQHQHGPASGSAAHVPACRLPFPYAVSCHP
jgi:hypothetical protein